MADIGKFIDSVGKAIEARKIADEVERNNRVDREERRRDARELTAEVEKLLNAMVDERADKIVGNMADPMRGSSF